MSMYAKVCRMRLREERPISEIARLTSLSRNTIKKWLKEPERTALKYARPRGLTKLDPYMDELRQVLPTDAHPPKRIDARRWCCFASSRPGYDGSYSRLAVNVWRWRSQDGSVTARSAYVPLTFEWGGQYPSPGTTRK